MCTNIDVKIILPDGSDIMQTLCFSTSSPWWISLSINARELYFEGIDLFSCLIRLRQALEEESIKLLCAGCRSDVYPSGMAREMSGGRKAYILSLGVYPSRSDLVDIFDHTPVESIGSVIEQEKYFDAWKTSIK